MKKALGQTVRDIKREVNKKVLKVPSIEQKVLDATSNEPWGPHGTLLADIAQATRNYHEYQMIMSVIWKRINDTGKNWRHVYKALTVLEYLVAHGSERVIDDIREHAYQISTLSDFQYIDSNGRDQGNNVRKKSQSLVVLVNDKERIQEVRQKAAANREKYRNTSAGSMYRPGSGDYGDRYDERSESRYGNRDDDRYGYGRERDDDRSGRYGDPYGREGDRYSRDSEERYGRDGYRDDDYRGRSQSVDDYQYGPRSRSADRDQDRAYEDDSQYSSRGSGAKADDHSQDGSTTSKRLERRFSEQNLGAPPSYEEAVGVARSPTYSERDGEPSVAPVPKAPSTGASPSHATVAAETPPPPFPASPPAPVSARAAEDSKTQVAGFDEFDPRGSFSAASTVSNGAAPTTSGNAEIDFLGSLSESLSPNSLALVPANEPNMNAESSAPANSGFGPTFAAASSASAASDQPFDDPFGDGPFRAVPTTDSVAAQQQITTSSDSFNTNSSQNVNVPQPVSQNTSAELEGMYGNSTVQPPTIPQFVQQDSTPNQDIDILADILPPSGSPPFVNTQSGYPAPAAQSMPNTSFPSQTNESAPQLPSLTGHAPQNNFQAQPGHAPQNNFQAQPGHAPQNNFQAQPGHAPQNNFQAQPGQPGGFPTQNLSLHANYPHQTANSIPQTGFPGQPLALTYPGQAVQSSQMGQPTVGGYPSQMGPSQPGFQSPFVSQSAQPNPPNSNFYGAYNSQHNFAGSAVPIGSQMGPQSSQMQTSTITMAPVSVIPAATASSAIVTQPPKDKFETKSTVWADTLSRGLVNLNISGSKTNPLNDIGVDFDAINRKEKRMEKPTTTTVTSTITMGKAMGSGSGMGRAGAGSLRPPGNPMVGSGMNMAPGAGMNMGGYGMNQPMSRGMGMGMGGMNMGMGGGMGMGTGGGMNMPGNMGMGMNMGMNQGMHMQQGGFPPGSNVPGGYNPMMGSGNYGQQPYGGYR